MTSFTMALAHGRRSIPALAALALVVITPMPIAGAQEAGGAKAKPRASVSQSGDAGLKARVESLEEQLVDMQVLVGTLESLARQGSGATPARASAGGSGDVRVDALENQVRNLSVQVQALSDQIRSMGGTPRRSDVQLPAPATQDFGATMSVQGDAIGGLIEEGQASGPPVLAAGPGSYAPGQGAGAAAPPPPVTTAAMPPAGAEAGDPKQLYETAYGYLLQRDYGAAQAAFDDFLQRYPSDSLAGNAQYWLGESHFVRGQYKAAASAFLKGYQSYAQSAKAPDSLLKLAMSLDRLGQKDAACASYNELTTKFPSAPQSVKSRAQAERQRVGCS